MRAGWLVGAAIVVIAPAVAYADDPAPPQPPAPASDASEFAVQPTLPFPLATAQPRFVGELEIYAAGQYEARDGAPNLSEYVLDRGEVGATVGLGPHAGAEVRLESIRSAADGGSLGIEGDALVIGVKRAQVFGGLDAGPLRVGGAFGLVGDPWLAALEDEDTVRPLSPTASERLLGWDVSDLAALGRAEYGPARLTVMVGNGEGLEFPERNTGKTTTAVGEVVVLDTPDARLRLAAMGRDGSVGPASVRDHRVGGAATLVSTPVSAGVELVRAWGVFDRGDAEATSLGGWAEVRPVPMTALAVRGGTVGFDGGGRRSTYGGGIAFEPWQHGPRARLRLWIAVDRTSTTTAASPLPGADPGDATTVMFLVSATAPYVVP